MRSCKCGGSEQAAAETRAFFVGEVNQSNGDGRAAGEFGRNAAQHFKGRQEAETAVQPAAIWNGVEMAAKQQRFFRRALQSHPAIARRVEMMFDGQAFQFGFEPGAGFEPSVGPGNTLGAVFIARESA